MVAGPIPFITRRRKKVFPYQHWSSESRLSFRNDHLSTTSLSRESEPLIVFFAITNFCPQLDFVYIIVIQVSITRDAYNVEHAALGEILISPSVPHLTNVLENHSTETWNFLLRFKSSLNQYNVTLHEAQMALLMKEYIAEFTTRETLGSGTCLMRGE